MKFTIELVASTNNIERYNIAGYLSAGDGESDLMTQMIETLNEFLDTTPTNIGEHIVIRDNKIIYNNIPMTACSNILKILQTNLDVKITTELGSKVKYIPADCSQLFKMELTRLFQ